MATLNREFKVDKYGAISNEKAIFKGQFYRITVLSDCLVRLEYDEGGMFEDRPTELAKFRAFNVPEFTKKENETVLEISTKYFTLQYQKEKPFNGTMFAQDAFLKVSLNKSDKAWYYSHDEARNFKGFVDKLETREKAQGIYI